MKLLDLHTHSTASDGSFSPRKIIDEAARLGLSAIALTDHDTLDGLEEAEERALECGIEFIRGCELSTVHNGHSLHILGLFIPKNIDDFPNFAKMMHAFKESRKQRNSDLCEKLQTLGIPISLESITNFALAISSNKLDEIKCQDKHTSFLNISIGRPHFAKYLVKLGVVNTEPEAFDLYLAKGKKAYIPRKTFSTVDVLKALAEVKAISILAHPALITCKKDELATIVCDLANSGLNGIEAYHSSHSHKDERFIVELATKHNLLLSGGSDFHGTSKKNIHMLRGKGSLRVPFYLLDKMKNFKETLIKSTF